MNHVQSGDSGNISSANGILLGRHHLQCSDRRTPGLGPRPYVRDAAPRSGITLAELPVVLATIGLLRALRLPALARDLALQTVCASNLRQVGTPLQEYPNEYAGQYPLNCTFFNPMGGFRPPNGYSVKGSATLPAWGLGMLYHDSYGVVHKQTVNPQPGILKPTRRGIAMIFSAQPGDISTSNQMLRGYFNA